MTVTSVSVKKAGTGKKGPWTMYAVELDNGTTASGFDAVQVGDMVTVEQKGQYLNYTKVGNGTGARQANPVASALGRGITKSGNNHGVGKEGYWERKEQADIAKQPRIERQHAQEMMLRYFAMRPDLIPKEISSADMSHMMREMTSWFQRDVGHVPVAPSKATESREELERHGETPADEEPF